MNINDSYAIKTLHTNLETEDSLRNMERIYEDAFMRMNVKAGTN